MTPASSLLARAGAAGLSVAAVVAIALTGAATAPTAAQAGPAPAPAPQGKFGTIKGRLVWGGASVPEPEKITANQNKDPQVCAKVPLYERDLVVDKATKGVAHAFVYLPSPKGKNAEAEAALLKNHPEVLLDQVNCEFVPYSTAGHEKQKWIFKSSDPVGHNVHYTGFTNNANFALGPNGSATKDLKAEKRPITLVCDIHPWMVGNMMVFDHPFYAVTKEDGSFEITGVPAGTQNIVVWQRKAGYVTGGGSRGQAVEVKPGEVTDIGEVVLEPSKIKK